jgi:hypothetical protein
MNTAGTSSFADRVVGAKDILGKGAQKTGSVLVLADAAKEARQHLGDLSQHTVDDATERDEAAELARVLERIEKLATELDDMLGKATGR